MLTRSQKIVIGVAVAVVVVAVASILLWYFLRHGSTTPSSPSKFKCNQDTNACEECQPTEQCIFTSKAQCHAKCQPSPTPGPPSQFCTTSYKKQTPIKRDGHWQMVADDVQLPECNELVNILKQGYLHGSPMTPICLETNDKTPPADPNDKMSEKYCNYNQFGIVEPGGSSKKTTPASFASIAPPGMTLTTFDQREDNQYFAAAKCLPGCDENATCIRGICVENQTDASTTRKKYKLALYHGGITGKPSYDTKCYINYLQRIADFVLDKRIDIVFISLQMPIIEKDPMQFPYYLSPDFIAKYFVDIIASKNADVEFGVLAYVNPKDSSWNFQDHTNQTPSQQDFKDAIVKANLSSVLDTNFNEFENTIAGNMQGGTSGFYDNKTCTSPEDQHAPYCTPNAASPTTPCPNIPAQVVSYVYEINQAIKRLNMTSAITYIAYDNEDMGGALADNNNGNCQFQIAVENLLEKQNMDNIKVLPSNRSAQLGYAYSMNIVANTNQGVDFVMPEMYWYMNMMGPCTGNNFQIGNNQKTFEHGYPQVCTNGTIYRDGLEKDANKNMAMWMKYIMSYNSKLEPNSNFGTDNFTPMIANMQKNPTQIWAMMSNENLSGSKASHDTENDLGTVPNCLARSMNANIGVKGDVCGTFDGMSYWSWDEVIKFYNTLYDVVWPTKAPTDSPIFGLYESQFLPPAWFSGDNVVTNKHNQPIFSDSFNSSCQLSCQDAVPCSTDQECADFVQGHCPKSTSYCADNKTCHISLPECGVGDNDCYCSTCSNDGTPQKCTDNCTCVKCPSSGHCQANNNNFVCCETMNQKYCDKEFCTWKNNTCQNK